MSRMLKILALTAMVFGLVQSPAFAQDWSPKGPIKILVGFGAGGSTDTLSRVLAKEIEKNTDWDVIVENKPGGGGVAMFSGLVRARPDGRTLGIGVTIPIMMNLAIRGDSLPFKADSFDYVGTLSAAPLAIAAAVDAPFSDFRELVEFAKTNDGALIGFDGKDQELIMLAINNTHGVNLKPVSHNTSAEVIQSMLGGHVDAGFVGGSHVEYVESGRLKMIAAATTNRHAYSPETETLVEQGFPYFVDGYFYVAAPKGLPEEVLATLNMALSQAVESEAFTDVVSGMALDPVNIGPDAILKSVVEGTEAAVILVKASAQ